MPCGMLAAAGPHLPCCPACARAVQLTPMTDDACAEPAAAYWSSMRMRGFYVTPARIASMLNTATTNLTRCGQAAGAGGLVGWQAAWARDPAARLQRLIIVSASRPPRTLQLLPAVSGGGGRRLGCSAVPQVLARHYRRQQRRQRDGHCRHGAQPVWGARAVCACCKALQWLLLLLPSAGALLLPSPCSACLMPSPPPVPCCSPARARSP